MNKPMRPYNVVVWGATGFTGKLVCEHIVTQYPGSFKWAIAGRNKEKLNTLKSELVKFNDIYEDLESIIVDASKIESVDDMTKQTDVLIACVGPYQKYGSMIVESSVKQGTHYVDITGEINWIHGNIKKYHEDARNKKIKIVHCCGYDSVPSDMATYFLTKYINKKYGTGVRKLELYISAYGGLSGGTLLSAVEIMKKLQGGDPEVKQILSDPFSISPPGAKKGKDTAVKWVQYNEDMKMYMAPTPFEAINSKIVRRSHGLLGEVYGRSFEYQEGIESKSYLLTLGSIMVGYAFEKLMNFSFLPSFIEYIGPKSGQGPSLDVQRKYGYWTLACIAYPEANVKNGKVPSNVKAKVEDKNGDPGYWSTSRMLLECAMCLVYPESFKENGEEDSWKPLEGGVLTPASAFGSQLVERLRNKGITFEIID